MNSKILIAVFFISLAGCNNNKHEFDTTGTFEVTDVVVSAEVPGRILSLNIREGDSIPKGKIVGEIDSTNFILQKQQVQASIQALSERKSNVNPQVDLLEKQMAVQQSQLQNLLHEKTRFENLLQQDAATGKQVDDIKAAIDVARKQLAVTQQQVSVQRNNISTQNRGIMSEKKPMEKSIAQINDQISKANITNPISGTVIIKYAETGELTSAGKALYDIADLSQMTLRAYISGTQLSQVKLNQHVQVLVDNGADTYTKMDGVITWISDKAEFTPKTIQTKDERANLVYAIKILVKNDGYLKIGMYGEVNFNDQKP
ncbi:MAG: HlyD family efflux transporter periplasmic adaptor subunit [Bacteroidota bacterium]|nr:HlyD family efflux transporter periplasmic adaptor subunit [Bacteroidota bacterium]